jgi:hypothetical protein
LAAAAAPAEAFTLKSGRLSITSTIGAAEASAEASAASLDEPDVLLVVDVPELEDPPMDAVAFGYNGGNVLND